MDCPRLAIKRGAVTEFWCWTVMRVRVCTCVVQMKNEDEEALGVLGKPGSVAAWSSAAPTSSAAKSSMKFLGPSNLAFHNLRLTRLLSCRHTSLSLSLSLLPLLSPLLLLCFYQLFPRCVLFFLFPIAPILPINMLTKPVS